MEERTVSNQSSSSFTFPCFSLKGYEICYPSKAAELHLENVSHTFLCTADCQKNWPECSYIIKVNPASIHHTGMLQCA